MKITIRKQGMQYKNQSQHKKGSFPLMISSVKVSCRFGHFTGEILKGKLHFFVHVIYTNKEANFERKLTENIWKLK